MGAAGGLDVGGGAMRLGRWAVAALVLAVVSPVSAQVEPEVSERAVQQAQEELDRLRSEVQELADRYQQVWGEEALRSDEIARIEASISDRRTELSELREAAGQRAVELYMDAASGVLSDLFFSISPSEADTRVVYLSEVRERDQRLFNDLVVETRLLEEERNWLQRQQELNLETLSEFRQVGSDLSVRLEQAQASYLALQRARLQAAAQAAVTTTAAPPPATTVPPATSSTSTSAPATTAATAAPTTTSTTTTAVAPTTTATTTTAAIPTTTATATTTTVPTTTTTTTTTIPTTTTTTTTTTTVPTTTTTTTTTIPTTTTTTSAPGPAVAAPPDEDDIGQRPEGEEMAQRPSTRCPVDGFSVYSDTWGAPRSGGRRHEGVDFLAARGTPVVAVEDGTVKRMRNGGLGGITVWLAGDSGHEYYYAHLDEWAPGLAVGQTVAAGDLLGTVGTTGNSPDYIPHLHWEYHPNGGSAVNPTPLARDLCG